MTDATDRVTEDIGNGTSSAGAALVAPQDLDSFLAGVERRAFRVAELALGHREDALDAVQDAMIKLMRYRTRPPEDWSPLFWSILRRLITDRHRRNAVKRRVMGFLGRGEPEREDLFELQPDPREDPLRSHVDAKSWQALGQALQTLPRRQRECFLLRELQGLSVAETALAMGCSDGSVKTHLSRAMSALRNLLEDWQ